MFLHAKVCANCGRTFLKEADFFSGTSRWCICTAKNLWFNCSCGSTLMLPKGKYPWYDPTKQMSSSGAKIFNDLSNKKMIPHIPSAVFELQTLLNDPNCNVSALAKNIKGEPLIAAEIMETSNNIKLARNRDADQITTIEHAISYLGVAGTSNIVLTASLRSFSVTTKLFTQKIFWNESIICGTIAEFLISNLNLTSLENEKEHVYLAACLANIGKLVSAYFYPEETDIVYQTTKDKMCTWVKAEEEASFDHRTLGEVAIALWGLPKIFAFTCEGHHRQPMVGQDLKTKGDLVDLIALSLCFTHSVLYQFHRFQQIEMDFLLEGYGISKEQSDSLTSQLITIMKQLKFTS